MEPGSVEEAKKKVEEAQERLRRATADEESKKREWRAELMEKKRQRDRMNEEIEELEKKLKI